MITIDGWTDNTCTDGVEALAALHGQATIAGGFFHVEAIRVYEEDHRQRAVDPAFQEDLDKAMDICGDGPLMAVKIEGYEGEYVIIIYPHAD